ncbi:MAG: 50S ribosomal protein L14 [Candidatus Woykebacteria bacterium RIFCSPHIGHO2_12_FULL_43_10]|uniref:Large ribosomal subunit protein uL14 n=2 Tax=Candidatus Woykeibacteriota TaxID=1817899 RepID=A0A1G1WXK1_9BACT|nr:MAG: 50S ribosomal protein L14 [Candidatus Woykebacteria bacterium RIFCSPHIGHO2_01_FULL_43_29]OGY28706.1 MAG: 50S ribosomal protein L14 [Candidatus Woykebacteria bacterium RIFCSPHIGHO2_02_FULL_43_16b]OGY29781.1 MAG: 50S ribosomal protein L14 [Candidatus Woykebacteria bacterium RIFCSPHIGHO2_12_FULL_43_10]OGY32455.1 MAG: 50S ribosomal protein L14 [Candidatus Woykebacteria bacterium RIFCSPLOWO2_01_FULL_43_14]
MVREQSRLKSADNSGAKELYVIDIPARSVQKVARLGEVITCVVKGADPQGAVKDGEIVKAVIVRTKKEKRRSDGSYIRFDQNAAVIIGGDGVPRGTRIFGPIAREVRDKGFLKIVSLAPEIV